MADKRTFWTGALWGAAFACIADQLVRQRLAARRRLALLAGGRNASVVELQPANKVALKREQGAGDPAGLTPQRSNARPVFERRGGAPGTKAPAAETGEAPGHPGERLDHSDVSRPLRSASRTPGIPPAQG